jgi:hypothetical protein
MYSRVEFFDAPEVKVALALLRCLVDPLRAGDSIMKRLVKKGSAVKVPLMTGLGKRRVGWPQFCLGTGLRWLARRVSADSHYVTG